MTDSSGFTRFFCHDQWHFMTQHTLSIKQSTLPETGRVKAVPATYSKTHRDARRLCAREVRA